MKKLLVMAGGTGGHIMPGLAVAEHLRAQGWKIAWLGNPAGMEAKLVAGRGYQMAWMNFSALRGKGLMRKLALPLNLLRGCVGAWRAFSRIRPDVVLGMGGYVTFPGGLVAALRGIPLVLHEQNSVAGLANRVLAKIATRTLCGFPDVLVRGLWTGNPVRPEITVLPAPTFRYAERTGPLHVLVVGGSLGAQVLNEAVPEAWALMTENERPQVVHQAGEQHLPQLQALYAEAGVKANCVAFIEDMAGAYAWADLVICRAGALTVAELAAAGVASVLVPYPHAVDDHQTGNAQFLARAGAAILLPQKELTAERLLMICDVPRSQWAQMAEKAHALARPKATADVAQQCADLAK
ncbi:UDP-N-acetylglucosamine--N-acetylmuramyl-(pentapeptide) pyrophosphoryl-UDP N-acetylglucosamine transferase [Rugosibacter aromaticivorans]|uniref:UDP-N-acetylglucosamine--N-acetylmuramyl-(pentapeptide) pyrophosphoryl-undecaprenol N-acetylglucosamine transferase n=1 Tax=Rugosibacter aromaticivorans TaxID=1565605 RepID=A0A0C5J6V7_9PROT|nr:undecaprenyldiphospho-muramoylpentapeptide beta-N-acetylglucosaminyltransferase [Rugosibacter aromaticivorans]AJP47645.1 UDP-N-acetylglucosamine--N-acetylmuramyl-(pentapeptide) pyrophosphoryl-UDP N-acetylglucosamine transferase [Rugosibacter aromaticivorans]TBR12822.1 MAG: undecaprenyldiphospho-muramoylpentapeptide beta-N-acetylglucosaminyltransferase [Rugosibacter sp.]